MQNLVTNSSANQTNIFNQMESKMKAVRDFTNEMRTVAMSQGIYTSDDDAIDELGLKPFNLDLSIKQIDHEGKDVDIYEMVGFGKYLISEFYEVSESLNNIFNYSCVDKDELDIIAKAKGIKLVSGYEQPHF